MKGILTFFGHLLFVFCGFAYFQAKRKGNIYIGLEAYIFLIPLLISLGVFLIQNINSIRHKSNKNAEVLLTEVIVLAGFAVYLAILLAKVQFQTPLEKWILCALILFAASNVCINLFLFTRKRQIQSEDY